jgi:hypothetical protein
VKIYGIGRKSRFPFVILQARKLDLCPFGIGAVDRLGILSQGFLSKPLGIARRLGAFGLGVAIGMECYAGNAERQATLAKIIGAAFFADGLQLGKQEAGLGEFFERHGDMLAKADKRRRSGFGPAEGDDAVAPIDVFRRQIGEIGLRRADMPGEIVERGLLLVRAAVDNSQLLVPGDARFSANRTSGHCFLARMGHAIQPIPSAKL